VTTFYGDLETYSEVPIKDGTYRYAENAEVMVLAYAWDEGPVEVVDFTAGRTPVRAIGALFENADEIVFHNSMFDRSVLAYNGVAAPIEKWRDTMVQALAHSLPGGLDRLCEILNIPVELRKLAAGRTLVQLFCKPRPANQRLRRASAKTHPLEWRQFLQYASLDVGAMRAISKRLPKWNMCGAELFLWHLDQKINDRGVAVDLELAAQAVETVRREQSRLGDDTRRITAGAVRSTTQRDELLSHILEAYEVDLPDMQKATLERRIDDPDLPAPVRELLANRLQASATASAKYTSLIKATNKDGRLRGTLQFCGASRTGRWAGRTFQPHNLSRVPKHIKPVYDQIAEAIRSGAADLVFGDTMEALGSLVRACIIASPGKKLVISDLANIEGRMLAWLAGETWKVDAFGRGDDLYVLAYARAFGVKPEVVLADEEAGGTMRLIGKVMELALGYQGAVKAFDAMARVYGAEFDQGQILRIVGAWRKANSQIVKFWFDLESSVREVILKPGEARCGKILLQRERGWLRIRLPSGRFLCYPGVAIDEKGRISYMGVNQYTRKWERLNSYGGKLVENVTQAAARDVLAHAMPLVETAGYPIVLTVHDEVITEVDDEERFTAGDLGAILAHCPAWAQGLPLSANGYETKRYRKG